MNLSISLEHPSKKLALFGSADRYLRTIREALGVSIVARDDEVRISGESAQVGKAAAVFDTLQRKLRKQDWLSPDDVDDAVRAASGSSHEPKPGEFNVFSKGKTVQPKTDGQKRYIETILSHDLTFCTGPAGTGKTYLAVAAAASLLKQGLVKRIILARPAVEAGERLGFLPGDLQAKVNPYLRPLFDALHDMMDLEQVKRFMVNDVIEVVPLAFMRGRTLNESAIILDEAQNTTPAQMLMFLTRLGNNSRMIVTGDETQTDLPQGQLSGLTDAMNKLFNVKGVGRTLLQNEDIVRHKLVQTIVNAYEAHKVTPADKPERVGPRQRSRT